MNSTFSLRLALSLFCLSASAADPVKPERRIVFYSEDVLPLKFFTVNWEGVQFHPVVTSETCKKVLQKLGRFASQGVAGPLPSFSVSLTKILKGERSLLSLGEGMSSFIKTLIESASDPRLIHALDVTYDRITLFPGPPEGMPYALKFFIEAHPQNYHFGIFQDFSVCNANGEEIMFDEIVSTNALAIVLEIEKSNGPQILKRVLDRHLSSGGVLRMSGLHDATWDRLKPVLYDWKARGIVSNFTDLELLHPGSRSDLVLVK